MESLHDRKILHWDHEPATGGRVSVLECGALRRFRTWCAPEKRRTACALQNLRVAARFMERFVALHADPGHNPFRVDAASGLWPTVARKLATLGLWPESPLGLVRQCTLS